METNKFKVILLPTEKASDNKYKSKTIFKDVFLKLNYYSSPNYKINASTPQHLYIISNDEIKEGEDGAYYLLYDSVGNLMIDSIGVPFNSKQGHVVNNGLRKIVATTDKRLGEPQKWVSAGGQYQMSVHWDKWNKEERVLTIPESFIQAYIKSYNEGCKVIKEIEVEMIVDLQSSTAQSIRTNSNNEVIVKQSETRMYSKDEVY